MSREIQVRLIEHCNDYFELQDSLTGQGAFCKISCGCCNETKGELCLSY